MGRRQVEGQEAHGEAVDEEVFKVPLAKLWQGWSGLRRQFVGVVRNQIHPPPIGSSVGFHDADHDSCPLLLVLPHRSGTFQVHLHRSGTYA